jgi:outer membrane protein TolC
MRLFLRKARWLVFALAMVRVGAVAQEPLTLRQAIQQALKQNPAADMARAGTQEAKAGAALARAQLLPQLSFTEDMSRGNDPVYVFGTKLKQQRFSPSDFDLNALNRPTPVGNFASRFSGSWMAFDSLRTQKMIRSADLMQTSAASSAKAVDQRIVFDVVQAYQGVLYAQRQVEVAQHELETAEALLSSVDDHVRAGLAVESDRMSAQVNEAAVKQALNAAQGGLDLAWAQLRVAMGAPELAQSKLEPIEPKQFPEARLDEQFATAAKTRPDLAAFRQAQSAQAMAVSAARLSYGPRVSAYGTWEDDHSSLGGDGGHNWVAGVQIGIELLPFSKRAQLARETAAKTRVDAQFDSYQQQVRLQVSQAHIQLRTARQSLETAKAAVDQSTESLRILRNRYGAGLATITDMLRGEDAERQAQANYWNAVYGNAVAYAGVLFATGTLTPDAAEELQ